MSLSLEGIRRCFEGAAPAQIATCAPDGTPNVAYLSQVHYVDAHHVALSFQFFSKTRENVLVNPYAMAQVIDPDSGVHYKLSLHYLRTETAGPLFQYMKARLAGVASHSGMSKVFVLRGADIYRVLDIHCGTPQAGAAADAGRASLLPALRACATRLAACSDFSSLLRELLAGLTDHFAIEHAMVLMYDAASHNLYTVASRGYVHSGVGSEIPLGAGVIGVAAQEQTAIRIGFMTSDYLYTSSVQTSNEARGREIPFPGLATPHSQLAVPITCSGRLLGVLHVESEERLRFTYEHEDALVALALQAGLAMQLLEQNADRGDAQLEAARLNGVSGEPAIFRRYAGDNSVFVEGDYLIKGVAGAILWKLLAEHERGRSDFTNRELRLDSSLGLPDISDNLEARLILLQRRLEERCAFIRIEKTGRGRFRLAVERPIKLQVT